MNARALVNAVIERIDALALRERALLFVVILGVFYAAVNTLVFAPLGHERDTLVRELATTRNATALANLKTREILRESGQNAQSQAALAQAKGELATAEHSLQAMTAGLVTPKEMLRMARAVLRGSPGVRLVSATNLAPTQALAGAGPATAAKAAPTATPKAPVGLYRHGLRLVVEGSYPALLSYLKRLEGLPWKVFWGKATLAVKRYPVSRLTVTIYTLSPHAHWISG